MHPDWVTKHKQKGTNIAHINRHYYLYAVTSTWNKEKQRAQKITKQYLGRITQQGITPPKTKQTQKIKNPPTTKEYGATHTLTTIGNQILTTLQKTFGEPQANLLFTIAALRVINPNPFKRIENHYQNSYFSELFPNLKLSGKNLSEFLKTFGTNRVKMVDFMEQFIGTKEHILFDGTSLFSKSEKLNLNRKGYNAQHRFDPQINLLYAFACSSKMPVYYRVVPGNVREVSALKLCVAEAGFCDVIVVADKGFGSEANFSMLENVGLRYIVPLRRNSSLFMWDRLRSSDKSVFEGFFMFNKRPVWYYRLGEGVVVFLDAALKVEEERRYLGNVEGCVEGYSLEGFMEGQFKFGTIVLRSNVSGDPCELYCLYKGRLEIEGLFDFLKNLLGQDRCYMQSEQSLEAWAFINHVSLMLNYKVYDLLREKKLLSNFSVAVFLSYLKYIFKIKINDEWHISEITKKTKDLLQKLNIPIT